MVIDRRPRIPGEPLAVVSSVRSSGKGVRPSGDSASDSIAEPKAEATLTVELLG